MTNRVILDPVNGSKSRVTRVISQDVLEPEVFRDPQVSHESAADGSEVLVICEDSHMRAMIVFGLSCAGFLVREIAQIAGAQIDAVRRPPDLILLKVDEFFAQGLAFTNTVKTNSRTRGTPLMVLSEPQQTADDLLSLEAGADDYLAAPFAPGELIARIHRLLRQPIPGIPEECIQLQGLTLNPITHRISAGDRHVYAPPTEYRFIEVLLRNPERVFTRSGLFRLIWGEEAQIDERTVDVYVRRVRKILSAAGMANRLHTVRGTGYCLSSIEPPGVCCHTNVMRGR